MVCASVRSIIHSLMICAPVRRDNSGALARGLSTAQAHKPCSHGLTGGFLLLQNFSVAISVSPRVCFILVLILISVFLR